MIYPDFHLPTRLYLQPDIIKNVGEIIASRNAHRALIITSSDDYEKYENIIEFIVENLNANGVISIIYDEIPGKANNEYIDSAVYYAKKTNTDIIIGVGLIESLNSAKAIAMLANNYYFCDDIFEYPKVNDPIPYALIPFMPSIGLEIVPCFYMPDIHRNLKRIYYNNKLYPDLTIIDPLLSLQAEDSDFANASVAALSIAVESLISQTTSDITNTYALKAVDLTYRNLAAAFRDPDNTSYRAPLALASVLSGISLTTSFMSITFAISLALSSYTPIPLSKSMGILLPHIMEYNLTTSTNKYVQIARIMDEDVHDITIIEAAIKAIEAVRKITLDVEIPQRLSEFEISKTLLSKVSELAQTYPFIKNAPRTLNKDELETILVAAF
ncbi:MAG: iron-containing alcohol dehydrogenase [Spirochaetes bacterium]|nr:iron-containing alcohol dehydrogenase [Spirochaetota bacterium]MBN2770916.1 iron-containing alcohol dehydrogenase [Spirochaetota bacterium]